MTNQEKLDFIREKCIEANPSITELKFGCEIKQGTIISSAYSPEWKCKCYVVLLDWGSNNQRLVPMGEAMEIIGRPIRLADVLLAFGYVNSQEAEGVDFWVDSAGIVNGLVGDFHNGEGQIYWNLKDDNLSHQFPETIDFLYQFLGGKED